MSVMRSESLLNFVKNHTALGDEIAIRQRRGYRMESWTYGRIAAEANRFARELNDRGISKGEAVVLWGENSAEWIIAFLGCVIAGVVIVPIDHGSSIEFARKVCAEVNAKLILQSGTQQERLTVPVIELEAICALVAKHDSSAYPSPSLSRQDTLEIIFTSGTTAEPRGVVITHGNVLANIGPLQSEIQKYLRYERIFHPIRFLNLLPLSHVFGQMLGMFIPPMLAGTSCSSIRQARGVYGHHSAANESPWLLLFRDSSNRFGGKSSAKRNATGNWRLSSTISLGRGETEFLVEMVAIPADHIPGWAGNSGPSFRAVRRFPSKPRRSGIGWAMPLFKDTG